MENSTLLKIAIATSFCGLFLGFISFYLSIWIDSTKLLKKNKIKWNDGLFYPIYLTGKIIGISILISSLIPSISSTIKVLLRTLNDSFYLEMFKFVSISTFVVLLVVIIINVACSYLIKLLFGKAEINSELNSNKYAFSILYSAFFIGFCLISKEGVLLISQILIPFEAISF